MIRSRVSGHFLEATKGRIFVLVRQPATVARGCVLVIPPFAEEMNKCRRMVTEVALGLAAQGVATVVPDLFGTGDSEGDFADGDWPTWQDDVGSVVRWMRDQGMPATNLLSIRLGCALTLSCATSQVFPPVRSTVLWQPTFDGGRFLQQFLRLRTAASLMEDRKETVPGLRKQLTDGVTLEVAGYRLSSRLASDLDALKVPYALPGELGAVAWLEVVRDVGAGLPLPSVELIGRSRQQGQSVDEMAFAGEPFWAATEIVTNEAVVRHSIEFLSRRAE